MYTVNNSVSQLTALCRKINISKTYVTFLMNT